MDIEMKRSLMKSPAAVDVAYSGGNWSHDLTGTDFELEEGEGRICLRINLAGNLHVRNKTVNCYADACELARESSSLKSVQIPHHRIVDGLAAVKQRAPNANWKLELLLGEKGTFDYPVELTISKGGASLNVIIPP